MTNIFKFALDLPSWLHGKIGHCSLQCLNSGHFVNTHGYFSGLGTLLCGCVDFTDILDFRFEQIVGGGFNQYPLWCGFSSASSNNLPTCLSLIDATIFWLTSSAANSRLLQWLIGRPYFSGGSQATGRETRPVEHRDG